MNKTLSVASALLFVLLMVACAPQAIPAPQAAATPALSPAAPAPAAASAPARPAWEVEWEKTLDAAKKEDMVVIAMTLGSATRTATMEGFKKAYGIPIEIISGKSSEVAEKVLRERRAGLYNYDVSMGGATTGLNLLKPAGALDPLGPALILPDVTDPELIKKIWWSEKLWWVDADHTHLAPFLRLNLTIAINTSLVKEGEIKSYRDLLNPKWHEKLVMRDPTISGTGSNFVAFADAVLGWDYLVELAKAKPIILQDARLMLDWLAHGKVPVAVAPSGDTLYDFLRVGAPIKGLVPAEGTYMLGGSTDLSIFNRRPHPNAAKMFVNWYLSKEGQFVVARAVGAQSSRVDVPTDHMPPEQVRQPGMKYFVQEDEKLLLTVPALQNKAKELFGPLMGK